jgi:hypothetical protein
MRMTTIGILGAGQAGSVFASVAIGFGYDVVLANTRGADTLAGLVREPGEHASVATWRTPPLFSAPGAPVRWDGRPGNSPWPTAAAIAVLPVMAVVRTVLAAVPIGVRGRRGCDVSRAGR